MRIVVKNLPFKTSEQEIKDIFKEYGQITDIYLTKRRNNISKGVCFIGYAEEESSIKAIKYRHKSYINNKKITVEQIKDNNKIKNMRLEFKQLTNRIISDDNQEDIEVKSKSLYVKNLPSTIEKKDIQEHFNDCDIEDIKFIVDENTQNFYGHVIITMKDYKSSKTAFLNKKLLKGCRLHISFYQDQTKQKNYFRQLFFNFESVVESICQEEKITRQELLDLKDENLGMKIALIETHLVEKTKKFLEQNKIYIENLTGKINRKTLIVRNSNLLSLNYRNCNVKIAPSKCLALLEFQSQDEAKQVYDELQYKRVKNKAIYVDYLPISFKEEKEIKYSTKIIVKNVPFQADKRELLKLFSTQIKVKNLRLPIKRDGMHKGYCFITVETPEDSLHLIKYFGNNTHLYGRRLVLEPAEN